MTNSKMTRKALFTSIMALMLCFAMLTGTTFAWFTDQETSANNKIIAGNLDIEMYNALTADDDQYLIGAGTKLFDGINFWEPGAVAYENITVVNKGNLALKYQLSVNFVDNGLAEALKVGVIDGGVNTTDREAVKRAVTTWMPIANFVESGELFADDSDATTTEKTTETYGIVIYWEPSDNDNKFNGNDKNATKNFSVDFGVTLFATQLMAEEDAFGKDYDENSQFLSTTTIPVPAGKVNADNELTEDVVITSGDLSTKATLPAGTKLGEDADNLTLAIAKADPSTNDGAVFTDVYAMDISVEGLDPNNTTPVTVVKKSALPTGLDANKIVAYHKGEVFTNYTYDSTTGDISVTVTSFCNFTFGYDKLERQANGLYVDSNDNCYIYTAEDLAALNTVMAGKYKFNEINIMDDIDFTGNAWSTVDAHVDFNKTFKTINGNNHTISNFAINGQAMFRRFAGLGDVIIKDITFDNATVNSTTLNSSILCVQSYSNVVLDNVDVKNSTIAGAYKVAPLIATVYNENSTTVTATLKNCDVSNTTVTSTQYDFMATGFVAFVNEGNNDKVVFENCTLTDTVIKGEDKTYKACAFVYCNDGSPEGCYNDVEGVTVTNSYAIYKSNHSNVYTDAAGNMYVFDIYGLLSLNTYFKNNSMNNATWGKTYNIMADIDADEYVWNCVYMNTGDNNNNGIVIDGHGHTISNLYIKGGAMLGGTPCGGNSNATPGYVRDLTFDNVHVEGEHYASVVWGGSAISSNVVYDNVHVINSDIIANCNVGAFVAATGEFNNSVTVKFKNCSVKNTRLTANGKVGQDPTGANAFIGRAYADTKVIFEGDNTVENNTFVNGNGLVGGGIYGYTIWDSTVEGNWRGTGCSNSFTNWDGIK